MVNKTNKDIIIELLNEVGLKDLVTTSFKEAQDNNRRRNIVIIDDGSKYFDIYLTYKRNGVELGEFICWVEDEFIEYEKENSINELIHIAVNSAYDLYQRSDDELDSESCDFLLDFKPY